MMKFNKVILIGLVLSLIFLLVKVDAVGLAIAPINIELKDASRGQEYDRMLMIYNYYEEETVLSLNVTGQCADWVSFYPMEQSSEAITNIKVPAQTSTKLIVNLKIPDDIPTGDYTCTIFVQKAAEKVEDGQGVGIRVKSEIRIKVIGTQTLSGIVKSITTSDTEINHLLKININFQNTGNVMVKPTVEVGIKKDGNLIDEFTSSEKTIKPQTIENIEVDWDTTGQTVGNYTAEVKVLLDGKLLSEKTLDFKILDRGTFTAEGKIVNVKAPEKINLGEVAKIEVQFMNTGDIDIAAKIKGEVFSDDNLIDVIAGDEILIKVDETKTITAYFKPEKDGSYRLENNVLYEGKTAKVNSLTIDVRQTTQQTTTAPQENLPTGKFILGINTTTIILSVVVVIVIVIIVKKLF